MTTDLFTPLDLRGTTVPNRLTVSPMCQYSVEEADGVATPWHHVHLGSRAVGGAGLVMAEATAVESRGRITPQDLGIWSDAHADALAETAAFVASQGAVPGIQLAHAGRKASTTRPWEGSEPLAPDEGGWETVAPSATPWPHDDPVPTRALSRRGIAEVVEAFRDAAARARDAGFVVAEVHAAHGYLLHQFLSPVTNDRADEYGGSFRDRTRIVREVVAAVRSEWPADRPVFVRISGTDWLDDRPSWTVEGSARLADLLYDEGADLIDVSSGGIVPDSAPAWVGPNYQVALAESVREESRRDVAVGAVGGITAPEQADAIVRNGRADLVIVGREFLRDPYFGLHAAQELGALDRTPEPVQYARAFDRD
jgi:2,4-dienoyl-CoA reductase-like NADH-dependent reductase (Old Yellow Enzyme family)